MFCIFGMSGQFATGRAINPTGFERLTTLEDAFDKSLKQGFTLEGYTQAGEAYKYEQPMAQVVMSTKFNLPVKLDDWTVPAGAFGFSAGPS